MAKLFIERDAALVTEQTKQGQGFLTGAKQATRKSLCVKNADFLQIIPSSSMFIILMAI